MIVCKFGGTSVASKKGATCIKQILQSNCNRKIVVVSALGKSGKEPKVTDQLYECFVIYQSNVNKAIEQMAGVVERYANFAKEIGANYSFKKDFLQIATKMQNGQATKEYIVSRGEWLCAKLYAKFLNLEFLDAKDYIIFNNNGKINQNATKSRLKQLNFNKKYVLGGFYGATRSGEIKLFERGGSDITGAIIAKLLNFEVYENYTDVNGVYNKDPNIFAKAKPLAILNYKTAMQMAEAGNEVVHKDALKLLQNSATILVVKNTYSHAKFGTVVLSTGYVFSYTFISVAHQFLLRLPKNKIDMVRNVKQYADVKKVFCDDDWCYVLMSNIYTKVPEHVGVLTNRNSAFKPNIYAKVFEIGGNDNKSVAYDMHAKTPEVGGCFLQAGQKCVCDTCEKVLASAGTLGAGFYGKVCKITIFANIKICSKHVKLIKKVQKILNNCAIWANFLNFNNNFVILCKEQYSQKVMSILNKYLQV